jgi:hypothetical protein
MGKAPGLILEAVGERRNPAERLLDERPGTLAERNMPSTE